jgi:hypothetical protein
MLEGRPPVDRNIKDGFIETPSDMTNIEEDICELLLQKIQEVKGKTQEECDLHNAEIHTETNPLTWIDYWDMELQQFYAARRESDPPTENGYGTGHGDETGPEDPDA